MIAYAGWARRNDGVSPSGPLLALPRWTLGDLRAPA